MSYLRKTWAFIVARKWYVLAICAIVLVAGFFLIRGWGGAEEEITLELRTVEVIAVSDHARGALGIAVPTANGDSFVIRSEAGGKVIRVAKEGAVAQGVVVAQLENSAQRAALTQAEGVYEAAVAAAGGNTTSQESARTDAVRTWTNVTVAAAETVRTSIDVYFGTIRSTQGVSGFQLESFGTAGELNALRTEIENTFDRWETEPVSEGNAAAKLSQLAGELASIGTLIDKIAALVPRQPLSSVYEETDRAADAAALAAARASISTLQGNVDDAQTAITNASNTGSASASAQVKQALGALEAARASYAKTVVRAPFAGTLASVSVERGDIISAGGDVAIIVPREGVDAERSFALPLSSVKYTPAGAFVFIVNAEGVLESREVKTGLVTAEYISATGLNGDEKILRDVRGLRAGERVTVSE